MPRTITGTVISDKADKTIVVRVERRKTHSLYRRQYLVSKHFMAHDEHNQARAGDRVVIRESRPLSARKHFQLDKIVEKPVIREVAKGEAEV